MGDVVLDTLPVRTYVRTAVQERCDRVPSSAEGSRLAYVFRCSWNLESGIRKRVVRRIQWSRWVERGCGTIAVGMCTER